MTNREISRICFSKHFLYRFVDRFGKKYGLTHETPRQQVTRMVCKILTEASPIHPTDPEYQDYHDARYGEQKMVKACGIVFFISNNNINTCVPMVEKVVFQKKRERVVFDTPFSTNVFDNLPIV